MRVSVVFDPECSCWLATLEWEEEHGLDVYTMTQVEEIRGNLTVGGVLTAVNDLLAGEE